MITDKGVLVKRQVFLTITPDFFPDAIWRQKQSDTWEGL